IICFVCGVKVLAKMIDFFLSDPNQSDEAQDSDSIKWRISLLKELESVIWPGMLSGGHAEVRLWLYSSSQLFSFARHFCFSCFTLAPLLKSGSNEDYWQRQDAAQVMAQ
ncbi:hypothetical protein S245_063750, partial [Arachis hypogaea]